MRTKSATFHEVTVQVLKMLSNWWLIICFVCVGFEYGAHWLFFNLRIKSLLISILVKFSNNRQAPKT